MLWWCINVKIFYRLKETTKLWSASIHSESWLQWSSLSLQFQSGWIIEHVSTGDICYLVPHLWYKSPIFGCQHAVFSWPPQWLNYERYLSTEWLKLDAVSLLHKCFGYAWYGHSKTLRWIPDLLGKWLGELECTGTPILAASVLKLHYTKWSFLGSRRV